MTKNAAFAFILALVSSTAMAMEAKDLRSSARSSQKSSVKLELVDFSQLNPAGKSERILSLYDRCKEHITSLFGENVKKAFSSRDTANYRDIQEFVGSSYQMQQLRTAFRANCLPYISELFYIDEYLKIVRGELIHRHLRGLLPFTPNKTLKVKAIDDQSMRHVLDLESDVVFHLMGMEKKKIKDLEPLAFTKLAFKFYMGTYYKFLQVCALENNFFSKFKYKGPKKNKGRDTSESNRKLLVGKVDKLLAVSLDIDNENLKRLHSLYGSPEYLEDYHPGIYEEGSLDSPVEELDNSKLNALRYMGLSFTTYRSLYGDENIPKENAVDVAEYYLKYRTIKAQLSKYVMTAHKDISAYIKGKPAAVAQQEFKLPDCYVVTPSHPRLNLEGERPVEDLVEEFKALDKKNKRNTEGPSRVPKKAVVEMSRVFEKEKQAPTTNVARKKNNKAVKAASVGEDVTLLCSKKTGAKTNRKQRTSGKTLIETCDEKKDSGNKNSQRRAKKRQADKLGNSSKNEPIAAAKNRPPKNQRKKGILRRVENLVRAGAGALGETAKRVAPQLSPVVDQVFTRFQGQAFDQHLIKANAIIKRITKNDEKLHILEGKAHAASVRRIKGYTIDAIEVRKQAENGDDSHGESSEPYTLSLGERDDSQQVVAFRNETFKALQTIQIEGVQLIDSLSYLSTYALDTHNITLVDNVSIMSQCYQAAVYNILRYYIPQSQLLLEGPNDREEILKEVIKARKQIVKPVNTFDDGFEREKEI